MSSLDYLCGHITVTRRADDYHACVTGRPECWDSGQTVAAAIGELIITHPLDVAQALRDWKTRP